MKRAFIIHGYQGYPDEAWQPWLKAELEKQGYQVALPAMPHPDCPQIAEWIAFIGRLVGEPDLETTLIGHSLGGSAVLRYLEGVGRAGKAVRRTVFVATGFSTGLSLEEADLRTEGNPVLRSWLMVPLDAGQAKAAAGKCTVILSDDDPYIEMEEARAAFTKKLGAEVIVERGMGHFNEDSHITTLPSVLAAVLA